MHAQVVIVGASGDLTARKLVPALASLARSGRPNDGFTVVGVARSPKDDEAFRRELAEAMPEDLAPAFAELAPRVHYVAADVSRPDTLAGLRSRLDALGGGDQGRLVYLALKPDLFARAVSVLVGAGVLEMQTDGGAFRRIVIEKPFGHDLASARALNSELHALLSEHQIYRIDHYLGKETVQNVLGFRFHNAIFEPLWNRHHVEWVQLTVAEEIGVEDGRAGYYDTTGALRDMLQNHMLQVLALVTMEPPASLDPEAIRDQKVNVLRALGTVDRVDVERSAIRARYARGVSGGVEVPGYAEEDGVRPGSDTETYIALRASIENWRWSGVPFLLRHGKRLPKKLTEVKIQFRMPPVQLFNRPEGLSDTEFRRQLRDGNLCQVRPNVLTLSIQPREAIALSFGVKTPGSSMVMSPAELSFDYRDHFKNKSADAYERLLLDALLGDPTLFLRSDEIEAAWSYTDRVRESWQEAELPLLEYRAGSWGPPQAQTLFYGCEGGWSRG
jgi:glucose-6-phosphate 1-dehydrogenase